jgi:hypothetical protein
MIYFSGFLGDFSIGFMPRVTCCCARSQCLQSTRTDKPAFRHWRQSDFASFWPEDWDRRQDEAYICKECYFEKLAIKESLQGRSQTRQGTTIPDAPREKATNRGVAELLTITPFPIETSAAMKPDPVERNVGGEYEEEKE